MKIMKFPMHLIVYSFVLWFADKKLTYGRFFHFSSHIIEDFELKIKTPRIRRGVSKKKPN